MKINLVIAMVLITFSLKSQKGKIAGTIIGEDKEPIPFVTIFLKNINKIIFTNNQGFFSTPKLNYGEYIVEFQSIGYKNTIDTIYLNSDILKIENKILNERNYNLAEFEVVNQEDFNIRKMRAIEGVMITQGKKTEAIDVAEIDANKATNLSRQIFAKIPGLNIWESDGAGIQIGLGGRGLNPSRNSNFNTRQNGYDISADALGYPESYYTPPSEAVEEIQLVRGAASLQFGPQFGGLINFKLKEGNPNKPFELVARHTVGSFGLNNSFLSIGGSKSKYKYYGYLNYKFGNDFRPNSEFNVIHGYVNIKNQVNDKTSLGFEFTKMYYLAQQPGGLTYDEFKFDPASSRRKRNWFQVDWNLANINFDYELNSNTKLNSRTFGLFAKRNSLGVLTRIDRDDELDTPRNLISGNFRNIGNETRLVQLYEPFNNPWAFVIGSRVYKGFNMTQQGEANSEVGPDFYFAGNVTDMYTSDTIETDYNFPSFNLSLFAEHIFNVNNKLSITPGFRYEYISTSALGKYRIKSTAQFGDVLRDSVASVSKNQSRGFIIIGAGYNFKIKETIELYGNFSQNYRSINFSDMQIDNPNIIIDPSLKDERGYNSDIGVRGKIEDKIYFDASIYTLFYNNRIGTNIIRHPIYLRQAQYRTNISQSRTIGFETMTEFNLMKIFSKKEKSKNKLNSFINFSYNNAKYINSNVSGFENRRVELVPPIVLKTGIETGKENFSFTFQYSYTDDHFSDATNSTKETDASIGKIYSYYTLDLSAKMKIKSFQIEAGVNNLTDEIYFTRRATGYPGPGIIPSPPRNFYIGLQIKL